LYPSSMITVAGAAVELNHIPSYNYTLYSIVSILQLYYSYINLSTIFKNYQSINFVKTQNSHQLQQQ